MHRQGEVMALRAQKAGALLRLREQRDNYAGGEQRPKEKHDPWPAHDSSAARQLLGTKAGTQEDSKVGTWLTYRLPVTVLTSCRTGRMRCWRKQQHAPRMQEGTTFTSARHGG
jgi:hypothetical protein